MTLSARVSAVLVLAVCAAPAASFADPPARRDEGLSFSTGDAGSSQPTLPSRAEVPEVEREAPREVIVGDFCDGGSGDLGLLDEVQVLLDEGKPAMARGKLGLALREGLEAWERPRAFAMAGEIALRLGSAARAVAWYRQALAATEEPPDPMAQLGLAVALLRSGRRRDAVREATSLATVECQEDGGGDRMACYGARVVLGLSAPTAEARARELERARTVRVANPDYDETFVAFQRLLPRPRLASLRLAIARAD